MATVSLQTDYWIETADPIANLVTDQWNFALTPHPSFSLKTDLWAPSFVAYYSNLVPQIIFFVGSDPDGDVQLINVGKDDDGSVIYYELETQELEFGNRAFNKTLTDKIATATQNADDSELQIIPEEKDEVNVSIEMGKRTNSATLPKVKGHYVTLRWSGESATKSPVLEGFYLNNIKDDGINDNG